MSTAYIYFCDQSSVLYDSYISVTMKNHSKRPEIMKKLMELLIFDHGYYDCKPRWTGFRPANHPDNPEIKMTEAFTWNAATNLRIEGSPIVFWCGRKYIPFRRDCAEGATVFLYQSDYEKYPNFTAIVEEMANRYYNTYMLKSKRN